MRAFGNTLHERLRQARLLTASGDAALPRLHVCFLSGDHAVLAQRACRRSGEECKAAELFEESPNRVRRAPRHYRSHEKKRLRIGARDG